MYFHFLSQSLSLSHTHTHTNIFTYLCTFKKQTWFSSIPWTKKEVDIKKIKELSISINKKVILIIIHLSRSIWTCFLLTTEKDEKINKFSNFYLNSPNLGAKKLSTVTTWYYILVSCMCFCKEKLKSFAV